MHANKTLLVGDTEVPFLRTSTGNSGVLYLRKGSWTGAFPIDTMDADYATYRLEAAITSKPALYQFQIVRDNIITVTGWLEVTNIEGSLC